MQTTTGSWLDLLSGVNQALDKLGAEVLGPGISDVDLSWSIEELQRIENRVAAEKLRRLAEFDDRAAYIAAGARSGGDWAARALNLTPGQAKALADTADRLQDLPETADKFAQGELGADQAAAAAKAAEDVLEEDLAELDELAAKQGCERNRNELRKELDAFAASKHEDHHAEKEQYQHSKRSVRRWTDKDGIEKALIQLPAWQMAHFDAALAPLSRKTDADDPRSPEQRRADALTTLCEQALNAGQLPEVAAQRPHLILITRDDDEPAVLDGFGPVSSATAAMIACDAETTEVVVDHRGHPLVVKPTKKNPTLKQRLAVLARDQHCVGCGAPASRCQVHHITWRRKGGRTIVANLVLVCGNCHFHIHHHGWQITQDAEGRYHADLPRGDDLRHTA